MHFPFALAFFDTETLGVMIPIVALMIPIVVVLTKHQQRMAEIIHLGVNATGNNQGEIYQLRQEVAELRSMVQRQAYAIDQLNGLSATAKSREEDLSMRLQQ